jgi:hypothetical protein
MKQPKKLWLSWQALGLVVSVILSITYFIADIRMRMQPRGDEEDINWIGHIAPSLLVVSCMFFFMSYFHLRRKLKAKGASELTVRDTRAPVLYLRSFADDKKAGRVVMGGTEEEQLAMVMNEIGPFITIGPPEEELSESGAARMYVDAGQWQERVNDLITKAQLAVIRIGETEGLWWEIQLVLSKVKPERIIFLIPRDRKLYERFRQKANLFLPHQLPEFNAGILTFGLLKAILYFERDWTPHIAKLYYYADFRFMMAGALRTAIRPVLEQLQIEPRDRE